MENENFLIIVEEHEFNNPHVHKIDSTIAIVNCFRDCNNKHFHTFKYRCLHDIKLTKYVNIEKNQLNSF